MAPPKTCPCCRHAAPHCKCRLDRPKYTPPLITQQPAPCQIDDCMNLGEIAYAIGQASGRALTTFQISGAIRALGLVLDGHRYKVTSRGSVILRQQTMVHKSKIKLIQKYIIENKK